MKKKLTIVWIVLIVFTLISAIISTNFSDNKYAINMIIFLAVLKFIGVSFYLMELKKEHVFWKISVLVFLVLFMIFV